MNESSFQEAVRVKNLKAKVALKIMVAFKAHLTKKYYLTVYFDKFNDIRWDST